MKSYPISDIISQVRIAIDENSPASSGALALDADNLDLDLLISQKISDAVRLVHQQAPAALVDGVPLTGTIKGNQDGSGSMQLPEDFMRLGVFHMDTWKRPVTVPIDDRHPDYILQKNKFVRGNTDKPVCVITTDRDAKKIVEYYSVTSDVAKHVMLKGTYLPFPIIANGQIQVCEKLVAAVVYMTAGLVFTALNETDRANYLMETARLFMTGNLM